MRNLIVHIWQCACRWVCMLGLACAISSCMWQEADAVVAMADSIDQNHHVIYDDTVALRKTIHTLNNPLGRTFKRSTLGKAFYYMGRNLEDDYSQVARAAECYVAADWLKIDDPIYRGRVNSCMGRICGNYNKDSLSLLFYERALEHFEESGDEMRYAYGLLDLSLCADALNHFVFADSLWLLASKYTIDEEYRHYLNDVRVHHFIRLSESNFADSIVYYLQKSEIINSWSAISLASAFYDLGQMDSAAYYATKVVGEYNDVPSANVSAYYILHLGNIRETYIHPEAGYKECMERTQYYPSGLPWVERYSNSEGTHPWKYNGKEFVEMHGLDEYDSKARWYYPAICRTTTMDPLAEKYYSTSPYAWCGNNTIIFTDANGCWFDFSGMTNEEKTAFDSDLSSLKDIPVFQKLYAELEESPERYSIQFGKTTYLDEHYVEGQFVPSKEGGGSITFLSGKQINSSVAAEEFFHAYQHHNRNSYADGEFNREFEAKTFVTLLVEHMGVGYFKGMFDFQQNIIFGVYGDNNHNTPVLYNSNFERDYLKYANIYANYNKTNNIGNYNYQRNTIIPPFSLKTLFNF